MLTSEKTSKTGKTLYGKGQNAGSQIPRDTNRYRIFEMLVKQPRLTVNHIAETLNLSKPSAKRQLKALEQINILEKEKQGQKSYYKFRAENFVAQAIINTSI